MSVCLHMATACDGQADRQTDRQTNAVALLSATKR